MGFWVAKTWKGRGRGNVCPALVTRYSCIDWRRAAWVFGGVRLISSASRMLQKMGPFTKRKDRRLVLWSSSRISVPVMSEGIRSGVNWIRLKSSSSTAARVLISRVLASPGTPTKSTCPRANIATRSCSSTSS